MNKLLIFDKIEIEPINLINRNLSFMNLNEDFFITQLNIIY